MPPKTSLWEDGLACPACPACLGLGLQEVPSELCVMHPAHESSLRSTSASKNAQDKRT